MLAGAPFADCLGGLKLSGVSNYVCETTEDGYSPGTYTEGICSFDGCSHKGYIGVVCSVPEIGRFTTLVVTTGLCESQKLGQATLNKGKLKATHGKLTEAEKKLVDQTIYDDPCLSIDCAICETQKTSGQEHADEHVQKAKVESKVQQEVEVQV